MSGITKAVNTDPFSKMRAGFAKILEKPHIEKIKKVAWPLLIIVGLLLADLGGALLNLNLPIFGALIIASGIFSIAYAILKIKGPGICFSQISKIFDLKQKERAELSDKKAFCYEKLTKDAPVEDKVEFTKVKLNKKNEIAKKQLFQDSKTKISSKAGTFSYDKSSDKNEHWTANFADKNLFGFAHTDLLAQDELQVLEHPGIYHLVNSLTSDLKSLNNEEIALVKGVKRKGQLKNIYGNQFRKSSEKVIDKNLTKIKNPHDSNIFAIVAPEPEASNKGKPYTKADLEKLFYRSYSAFESIKKQASNKEITIHTGNWGAGAFGGSVKAAALCQMAAAKKANVDNFIFYPMDKKQDYDDAKKIFENFENENPDMKVGEFINHIHEHANSLNLVYGASNKT